MTVIPRGLAGFVAVTALALTQAPARLLDRVAFEVQAIEDSSGYFLYSYRLSNSPSSRGAVAAVNIDLSSAPGADGRAVLPSTGRFINTTGTAVGPVRDHVPIGAVTPENWIAALMPNAILSWAANQGYATDGPFTRDSAAVGGSKEGFGLRSPYYPAIRRFSAEPTLGSCCARPKAGSGEYPVSGEFRIKSVTVAPGIRDQDITVETVRADLQQVCGPLQWIAEGPTCGVLRGRVQEASAATQRHDAQSAKQALNAFLQELDDQHDSGKVVTDNAYWLLKTNASYLLAHL